MSVKKLFLLFKMKEYKITNKLLIMQYNIILLTAKVHTSNY